MLVKLTGKTNLKSIFNNRFIIMTNVWVWAWNQKPWCTDVRRHMHCWEDAEVKTWHLSPTIPSLMGGQVTYDVCENRTSVYKSTLFQIKKKKTGENLICVTWLSSGFWLRQHGPFLSGFSIKLVLDHSLNPSIKVLSHSINQAHSLIHPLNNSLTLSIE